MSNTTHIFVIRHINVNEFSLHFVSYLNNLYMLGAHLIYVTLFSSNILVMYLFYVTKFATKHIYLIVVPDICCSKDPTICTCLFSVCSTPPDTVSNYTVFNGIIEVVWLGIMIMFQLRHHRKTACHSQPLVMATWQIGVGDGPHAPAAHSARQDMVRQLFTQ